MGRDKKTRKKSKEKKERYIEKSYKKDAKKPKKKRNFLLQFIGKILLLLFVFIILLAVYLGYKTYENGGGVVGFLCTIMGQSRKDVSNLGTIDVLLLGVSKDIQADLTDTIMIVRFNPQTGKIAMLSIPRDTFVGKNKDQAKGSDKINSLYTKGTEKLEKEIEELTSIEIEYYAVVSNDAVINIVDIMGGVWFDVPIDMNYDDPTQDLHIHLEKGYQLINGEKAEQLLRFRHNNDGTSYPASYGDNDFGRMKTQRAFIEETLKQLIDIKNLPKVMAIKNAVFNNIETNAEEEEVKKYIPLTPLIDVSNIKSYQLPGQSERCNDLWFFVHSQSKTNEVVKEMCNYVDGK